VALLVLLIYLIAHPRRAWQHVRRHAVWCGALVVGRLCGIDKVYFGNTLVLTYDLPPSIEGLVTTFGSGRFIWPAAYSLMRAPRVRVERGSACRRSARPGGGVSASARCASSHC
jgi:hypothetical protein